MKTLTILVCCAFVVQSSCNGISIIGSKYIRANRPYTVAVANSLNKAITLKLSLECEDSETEVKTYRLASLSGKTVQFSVPIITFTSDCIFSAINDGGEVTVNHNVILEIPDKTVSIFILTDKPVYKPGDELRFRVVVVDIETKPVTNINAIEVLIEDPYGNSVRHWPFARLNKGVFETSYQMAAEPVLGKWTITVTVDDSSISNKKIQSFEVMEYVLPKFAVKAWPTKTLLIGERIISLIIDSHYTFGERVEGKVRVNLYLNKYTKRASHEAVRHINGSTVVEFRLMEELEVEEEEDYTLVNMTVAVTDSITKATVSIEQIIPVYLKPHKISLVKPYRPGAPYHFKVSVKDHTGVPVEKGKMIKIFFGDEETQAPLDDQGLASFVISTPHEVDSIAISAEFESVKYEDIGFIKGLESSNTQFLQIQPRDRFKVTRKSSFAISSNEPIEQFSYFVVTRGSIVDFGHIKFGKRKTHILRLKLTEAMAPKATLVVFFDKDGQFIADYCDLNFESFGNDFVFRLDKENSERYRPKEEIFVEGTAQEDSIIFIHAIDQSALLLGHTEYGLTKHGILDDLDQYNGRYNVLDLFDSMGLFFRSDSVDVLNRFKRAPFLESNSQRITRSSIQQRSQFPEAWLWRNSSMNRRSRFEIKDFVPDTITTWYVTGFALSPTRGLGIMNFPWTFSVDKPFYMVAHLPYSIKRGEVAPIQVTLYNFLGNRMNINVILFNKNDEIEFVEKFSTDDTQQTETVELPSHQVKLVSFLIKAKKLGEIAIRIEADNGQTSDGLEHLLRVTPESRQYEKIEARFIDLLGFKKQTFNIRCGIPRDADPGSIRIQAIIDHDLKEIQAMSNMSQILPRTPIDYIFIITSESHGSLSKTWKMSADVTSNLYPIFVELPGEGRIFKIEFIGTGYAYFQLSYQYRINIGLARQTFNLNIEMLQTSSQEVQDLKVCLNYQPRYYKERSNKALVEIYLSSGFVVNDDSVRDLSPGKEIKKTMPAFDGTAMYVYYNSVGQKQVCFNITAHRQFKTAMHRLGYVVVYDTEDRDRFALATFEEKVLQSCDVCENEDSISFF